jgi:hypothetical protein
MSAIDWSAYAALLIAILLGGCIALLLTMLDRVHEPLHVIRRQVWCPRYKRVTAVEFDERVQTGMAFRSVRACALRRAGEKCGDGCVCESGSVPIP